MPRLHSERPSAGILAFAAATLLAACAAQLPEPTALDAERASTRWPGITLEALGRGRTIYSKRCGTCHTLYVPTALPSGRWAAQVAKMAPRARLDAAQAELVARYLTTITESPPP